nr:uncharacterized protein LOC107278380 [Oryza sativa Japonica Group]
MSIPLSCSPTRTGKRDEEVPPKLRSLENLHRLSFLFNAMSTVNTDSTPRIGTGEGENGNINGGNNSNNASTSSEPFSGCLPCTHCTAIAVGSPGTQLSMCYGLCFSTPDSPIHLSIISSRNLLEHPKPQSWFV